MVNLTKLGLFLILAGAAAAQNETAKPEQKTTRVEPKYFRMDFTVKEVENGKVVNSRAYMTTLSTDSTSQIRTGSKLPVSVGPGSTQFIDVGVNIDCRPAREVGNQIATVVTAELSSVGAESSTASPPVIRQNKWSGAVLVPLRKPALLFSADDLASKRQMQLEVTATPIP